MEGCRRRYNSVSNHSIRPWQALCLRGVGGGGRPRTNIRCHTQRQWMDNGYPSIFHASLSHGLKPLQCPSQSNLIPSADSFISLTSFAIQTDFLKRGELDSKERMSAKYWIWGKWPKYSLEHSRWAMVFISVPWWLIYLVDRLFITQPIQTCIWVAWGKFRGVLLSGSVAQPCTSPSANWPHRVIRT